MHCRFIALYFFVGIHILHAAPAGAVTIPTVAVRNVGNAGELTGAAVGGTGPTVVVGAVAYSYRIGTTEVTNAQYAEFLNAKAASDPFGLFNTLMGSNVRGGILRGGFSGAYTYSAKANMGNKPVNYVSWYDAIRFANWLHNGQASGDTETGAYTILDAATTPSDGLNITRNQGAQWFLPSESEWYKAAYYQPAAQGGDIDGYWAYATASNVAPGEATATSFGDISNPGPNVANYSSGAAWNGLSANVTSVGSAGLQSVSHYGTSDQNGNVWEWNEALLYGTNRGLRGGSRSSEAFNLHSSYRYSYDPTIEDQRFGFRVATVPEPASNILAAIGLIGVGSWSIRRTFAGVRLRLRDT